MEQMKKNDLGKDSIGKLIVNLTIPAITAQLINALYNIVDRIYIGRIPEVGGAALTGVGVTFPIVMLISAFGALLGMGGAPKAAIKMGEKDNDSAEEILGNCFSGMIVMAVILTIFFLLFQKPLLMMFGASDRTVIYGLKYLNIYVCGTIFVQATLVLNSFITAQGFARTGMLTVLIGAVLNIVLDPILIFYFKMGVQGAAIATVVSQAVSAIWVTKFLTGKNTKIKIKKEYFKIKKVSNNSNNRTWALSICYAEYKQCSKCSAQLITSKVWGRFRSRSYDYMRKCYSGTSNASFWTCTGSSANSKL